jgi:hypothetical protein
VVVPVLPEPLNVPVVVTQLGDGFIEIAFEHKSF